MDLLCSGSRLGPTTSCAACGAQGVRCLLSYRVCPCAVYGRHEVPAFSHRTLCGQTSRLVLQRCTAAAFGRGATDTVYTGPRPVVATIWTATFRRLGGRRTRRRDRLRRFSNELKPRADDVRRRSGLFRAQAPGSHWSETRRGRLVCFVDSHCFPADAVFPIKPAAPGCIISATGVSHTQPCDDQLINDNV